MLVLVRRPDEAIRIGDDVRIVVMEIRGRNGQLYVRLGIDAPKEVPVHREEVWEDIQREESGR